MCVHTTVSIIEKHSIADNHNKYLILVYYYITMMVYIILYSSKELMQNWNAKNNINFHNKSIRKVYFRYKTFSFI